MIVSRSLAIALLATAVGGAAPALAGSTVAEGNYERIQEAWEKAEAAGGYGIPFVAVPEAIMAALASDDDRQDSADDATARSAG